MKKKTKRPKGHRQRLSATSPSVVRSVRLSQELGRKLGDRVRALRSNRSVIVRTAIAAYLETPVPAVIPARPPPWEVETPHRWPYRIPRADSERLASRADAEGCDANAVVRAALEIYLSAEAT